MTGLRSVFDDKEVRPLTPAFAGTPTLSAGQPSALQRGFRQATLGGQAADFLWQSEEAMKAGDVEAAAAYRSKYDQLSQMAQLANPNAHEFTDFLPGGKATLADAPAFVGEAVGGGLHSAAQMIPASLGGTALGLGASLLTRGRISPLTAAKWGGLGGAGAAGYNMNAEETLQQLATDPTIAATTTPDERLNTARVAGAGMGALDMLPIGLAGSRLMSTFAKDAGKRATIGQLAGDVSAGIESELITGGAQGYLQERAKTHLNPQHETDWGNVLNNAVAEGLGGLPMHGGQAVTSYALGKPAGVAGDAVGKIGDFVDETVLPGAKKAYDAAKKGAGKTVDAVSNLDDAMRAAAGYANDIREDYNAAKAANPDVTVADVAVAEASNLADIAKQKLGSWLDKGSDEFANGLKAAEQRMQKMGFTEPGARETKDFLERVANAPDGKTAQTVFEGLNEGVRNKVARYTRMARESAQKFAEERKKLNEAVNGTEDANDEYGLGNKSLQGVKGVGSKDLVNKAARSAIEEIKTRVKDGKGLHSVLDNIANRITSGSVMFHGRPNVSKTIRMAIDDALKTAENEDLAADFNDRKLYNALYDAVKDKVERPVQEAFDQVGFKESAKSGVREMLTPVIKALFFESNDSGKMDRKGSSFQMSDDQIEALASDFSTLLPMLAETGDPARANRVGEYMIDRFGSDRAMPAIEAMQAIANSVYGDGRGVTAVNALGRGRSVSNLSGELRNHLNAEETSKPSVLPRMKEMLSNFKKVESAVAAGHMNWEDGNALLKAAWSPYLKDASSFEHVLPILQAYDRHGDKIDTTTIARDNDKLRMSEGGSIAHANREGEFSGDDQTAEEASTDSEDKTDVASLNDVDPDKKKAKDKREGETGQQGNIQAPLYYGHHAVIGKPTREGEIQAPVDTYPSEDYPYGSNNATGSEFGRAIENTFASASHRLADVKKVRVLAWAEEVSEATGQDYFELLNKAMDALVKHDKLRRDKLSKVEGATESLGVIDTRAEMAEKAKSMYGKKAGEAFFTHPLNKNYRYIRTEQGDASNIALTADQLSFMGPRKGETAAQYDIRMSNGIRARANLVADSRVAVAVKGENVPMEVDLARVVMSHINYHQQGDISSVSRGFKDAHVDPLGSEKDTERALAGSQDFGKALLDALHNTITSIYLARGIDTNASEIIQGLTPDTVVYRDFDNGRIIRYGMLRKFKGYENVKNSPWTLSEKDVAKIVLPVNSKLGSEMVGGKRALRGGEIVTEGAMRNPRFTEAAARNAERGIAMRAVTKDGKTFDLNVHELVNNMLEQYGIDPNTANHEDVMSKELAAFLLKEGIEKLAKSGYSVDLNRAGDEGSVQSFYKNVMVFKGQGTEDSRYNVTYGSLKNIIETFQKKGTKLAVDFKSSQSAASKARLKTVEKILADADKMAKIGKPDPGLELRRTELEARRDKLIEDLSWATGVPVERVGDVGDGQIDISAELQGGARDHYGERQLSDHFGVSDKYAAYLNNLTPMEYAQQLASKAKLDVSARAARMEEVNVDKALMATDSASLNKMKSEQPALFSYVMSLARAAAESKEAAVGPVKPKTDQKLVANVKTDNAAISNRGEDRSGSVGEPVKVKPTATSYTNAREREMQRTRAEAAAKAQEHIAKRNERAARMGQRKADLAIEAENVRMLAEQEAAAKKSLAAAVEQSIQNKKERNRVEIISERDAFDEYGFGLGKGTPFSKQGTIASGLNATDVKAFNDVVATHNLTIEQKAAVKRILDAVQKGDQVVLLETFKDVDSEIASLPPEVAEKLLYLSVEEIDNATQSKLRGLVQTALGDSVLVVTDTSLNLNESGRRAYFAEIKESSRATNPNVSAIIGIPSHVLGKNNATSLEGFIHHEIMHGVIAKLLGSNKPMEIELAKQLIKAANSSHVKEQLKNLLPENAFKYIEDNPEEAVTYAYQFWNDGLLKLGAKPNVTLFQKLRRALEAVKQKLFGDKLLQAVFEAVGDGEFKADNLGADTISKGMAKSRELGFHKHGNFSKQKVGAGGTAKSAEHVAAIQEMLDTEVRRLLGKLVGDVKLVGEKAVNVTGKDGQPLKDKDGKVIAVSDTGGWAGISPEDSNEILVALSTLDHLGVLHHEAWHQVERILKGLGPQGEAVLKKIYEHVNRPEMVEALRKYYNDEGVSGQLDSTDPTTASQERAAFAFQLFMREKKLPLAPATRSKFQAIKDFVKKMLAKIGMEFSNDNDQVEAFFNYINQGGFLRDNTNPEAMIRALKMKNGDKALAKARSVVKPIQEAFDVVFGHTAERLRSANIPEYNEIIERYVGKDGKSGYLGRKRMRMNQFGNEAGAILAGMTEEERANFARHPKFKEFVEKFEGYMQSRGMLPQDVKKVLSNLSVFDQDLIDANFKEFYDDLAKHGGLDGMDAGDIRSAAQEIADKGYISSDAKLFPNAPEVLRKWQNFDAKDYMARLIALGVDKAERRYAFGPGESELAQLREAGDKAASGDVKRLAKDVIDSLNGDYKQNSLSPRMKRITQMLMTVNNIRLLPFAVFSQAIEPLQIALRANKQMSALDTMWRGVKEMPRTFDAINEKMYSKDFWEKFGEQAGTVTAEILGDIIGQQYNGMDLQGVSKKVNNIFFKYNFMQQWDRSMRIAATKQASYFLLDHANALKEGTSSKDKDGGLRSERFLRELGLTKEDVYKNIRKDAESGEFHVSLDDDKIRAAVNQFVEEALAHPDVGSNPLWANDVRFSLIAHMKRFSFAQARYVLGRIGNELSNGNYAVLSPVMLAVPWMLLSDMFKDLVKPGDEAYKDNWGLTDYLLQGIDRAGLGRAAIPLDAIKAQSYGGNAVEGALGPTAELFGKTIRGVSYLGREKAGAE